MDNEKLRQKYVSAAESYTALSSKEENTLFWLSVFRLVSFFGGLALIWLGFGASIFIGLVTAFTAVIVFLFLLKKYSSHSQKKEFLDNLVIINRNEGMGLSGNLSPFPDGKEYISADHDFSNDVDVFGDLSLFQYLNRTVTSYGSDILAKWLSDPFAVSADLSQRQEVIKELSLKKTWRHEFMATGMNKPLDKGHIRDLYTWLNEKSFIGSSKVLRILMMLLPGLTLLSFILFASGIIHYSFFVFFFLLNLLLITFYLKKINDIHNVLSKKHNYLSSIARLLEVFDKEQFDSVILKNIKRNLAEGDVSAIASLHKLTRLIQTFDSRMNILVSFVLNGLLLWDFHTVTKLEKWKQQYGKQFLQWLEMAGEVDAFISLGNFAANNSLFVFPLISESEVVFHASELGHPLIESEKRVSNDFSISHPGLISIITGANMAGKSTFLRTVAVNYILAMTGAPVCASAMIFRPLKVFTSMRTTDSLSHNESYFYAELKRLKQLKLRISTGEPILFILDEILKGTNSADKSLGSHLFLKRLVEMGGTGFIATHDISVGEMEKEFPESIVNKCFEIDIDGELIKFDYKLKDGIAFRMNAALLMKQMGILD